MKKLWEKTQSQMKEAEQYCFADTVAWDNVLIPYDIFGSLAHANMLHHIGILTNKDYQSIRTGLLEIKNLYEAGEFLIVDGDEDVHTKIEQTLTENIGTPAQKLHTARSRNDQVLTDLRLYSKEHIVHIANACIELTRAYTNFAKQYEYVPMPGYTHMQKAMPSSIGMWAGSFAESILDDIHILKCAFDLNDQSPLGSGAAYGISLPIDRAYSAHLLGFNTVQNNSLYSQCSRGKTHLIVMHAAAQIFLTLSRFAQDMLLFTTSEFNFFSLDPAFYTGSSIMPQKQNVDVLEFVRARTHTIIGYEHTVASLVAGLPSGYNADIGESKGAYIKTIELTQKTLHMCAHIVQSIKPNTDALTMAMSSELFATHAAYELVQKGIPFRQAYKQIGASLDTLPNVDPISAVKSNTHIGSTGNLQLENLYTLIRKHQHWWKTKYNIHMNAMKKLLENTYE